MAISKLGSQRALAEHIGVQQGTISKYLTGVMLVPIRLAIRLDKECGVPKKHTRPDVFGGK